MTPKGWEALPGWVQAILVERGLGTDTVAEVEWQPPRIVRVKKKPVVEVIDVTIAKAKP